MYETYNQAHGPPSHNIFWRRQRRLKYKELKTETEIQGPAFKTKAALKQTQNNHTGPVD